jgi:hypothetical protein
LLKNNEFNIIILKLYYIILMDNFYFSTDKNKYVPIKTDLDIRHSDVMNTSKKSDNKIGLIYNTDTNNYQLKSVPKHMKIIKDVSEVSNISQNSQNPTTNDFDISEYYSDVSLPSETSSYQSIYSNPYDSEFSTNSENSSVPYNLSVPNQSLSSDYSDYNPFKQNSKQNSDPFKQNSKQNSDPFKQNTKFNTDLLNDVNNSLSALNMQVMSLCNKKNRLSNEYKHLVSSQIKHILNRCN